MIPPQRLLISRCPERSSAAALLAEHEVHPPGGVLAFLIESQDPWGATLDLGREDRLRTINEKERGFSHRFGCGRADRPQHGLELVNPAPAVGLELSCAS